MTDAEILRELPRLSALVVGDICLDRWCRYDPALSIVSVETGIPRVAVTASSTTPGAGGTIANNLAALRVGRVSVLGVVGDDGHGFELRRALRARGITDEFLVESAGRMTFTYTKLINQSNGVEDLPRLDFLYEPDPQAEQRVLESLARAIEAHDVILISDQAETDKGGVITAAIRERLAEFALQFSEKVFMADSRRRAHLFRNVCLKPNGFEADEASRVVFSQLDLAGLRAHTRSPTLMVTRGGDGVDIVEATRETRLKVKKVENPVDVCGAGDSFAAGAAVALFLTKDAVRAAEFGCKVASVTIGKPGTGTASPEEVAEVL